MRKTSKVQQQPPDAFHIFLLAMEFTTANVLLYGHKEEPNHPFMTAWSINELFVYELMLKCLICLESKRMARGHDLAALYYQLSPSLQNTISEAYEGFFSRDINLIACRLASSDPESFSFRSQVKQITDAYIKLRYFFDRSSLKLEYNKTVGWALEHSILKMKPEWKPWSSLIQANSATHIPVSSNSSSMRETIVSPPRT